MIKLTIYQLNAACPPQTIWHDQIKIRQWAYGPIKPKNSIVLWHGWKTQCKGWMIQNSGCRIRSIKQANKLIGSKKAKDYCPNLNLKELKFTEWQRMYLEQEAAFLSGKYKKAHGKQNPK